MAKRATTGHQGVAVAPSIPSLPTADMIRVAGIDPGASTGLVCLDVPLDNGEPDLALAQWVGHAVVHPSQSTKLSDAEQRAMLGQRIAAQLAAWEPGVVVLEEPIDWRPSWENRARATGGRQSATAFGLGAHFGLALAAAVAAGVRVHSHPVNNYRGRAGWMQAGASRPQSRYATLTSLRLAAAYIGAPDGLSEDVLMALGVARFHITHRWEADRAAA